MSRADSQRACLPHGWSIRSVCHDSTTNSIATVGTRGQACRSTGLLTQRIHSAYSFGMSVPVTLLGLLERQPSHGYELKREYDAYFGRGKPLPFGQVYATLSRLVRDNKVEPGE